MNQDDFTVPFGQLTFDAEGQETRGRYFSRRAHVPGAYSGVTIGRGYDMGQRSGEEIVADLMAAGVAQGVAVRFAPAAGLRGTRAKGFLRGTEIERLEITPAQQKALFVITYERLAADVRRICASQKVVERYGPTDWDALHPRIRDVVVDLRYRGDYIPSTRKAVQPRMVANDLDGMRNLMADERYWRHLFSVPLDRFQRRMDYLAD